MVKQVENVAGADALKTAILAGIMLSMSYTKKNFWQTKTPL